MFIYSEKATNFCDISTVDLSYVVPVKSTVEILQNFVAFSEYMNFNSASSLNTLNLDSILIYFQGIYHYYKLYIQLHWMKHINFEAILNINVTT